MLPYPGTDHPIDVSIASDGLDSLIGSDDPAMYQHNWG